MEIKLEVVASTCIKQKKPWPRITWLGQEKEAVYLLDDRNINEINLISGRTKKKIPQLYPLLKNTYSLSTSRNGAWLAGILRTGELFLWNKDQDTLKTVPGIEESKKVVTAAEECSVRLHLDISGEGSKVLLATSDASVFLWESLERGNTQLKNYLMSGWSQIIPAASVMVPSGEEKETSMSSVFIKNETLGSCCLCCFTFCSENDLILTFLQVKWQESGISRCWIQWAQQTCDLHNLFPRCETVKSRGALLSAFSSDGLVIAMAINQKDLRATQILFMSTVNFVTASGTLKGCGSKNQKIPSKLLRSYWVADMSWTPDSLFLACMLKRGSLILMNCLGELMTLITYGCSVEFGPADFIPLHPLITYRPQNFLSQDINCSHNSSASEEDNLRQRFSVTSHPSLPYLIASDGYIVTVLRFSDGFSPSAYMRSLLLDSGQRLEKLHHSLFTSKIKTKQLPLLSLSSLRASLLRHPDQISVFSAVPKFLQREESMTELSGEATYLQEYNEDSDEDKLIQNYSSVFWNQKTNTSLSDGGQLEFATMFDTIHAVDETEEKDNTFLELDSIQKNLITAWRIGISRNVQERDPLLYSTIQCIIHFFNILQYTKLNFAHLNNPVMNCPWIQCILNCFQQFLSVLSWEGKGRQTLGHLMKLTLHTLKLILTDQQDQFFPSNILGGFSLLKMVTYFLNGQNSSQYVILPAGDVSNEVELDSVAVPLFQAVEWINHCNFSTVDSILKLPPRVIKWTENSEKRIIVMWRLLYEHVVRWWTQLNKKNKSSDGGIEIQISREIPMIKALAGCIQAVIQSSREGLEETLNLNSVTGEEQFLMGSYKESVEEWEKGLQGTKQKGGKRVPFLQTRYYLATLYCHLYHYNLREAQGMCDHLVHELLKRSQISVREKEDRPEAGGMLKDVRTEAVLAVIRSLARFMAAYFTNEPLYVLPPHHVDVLPPLHIKPEWYPRVIPLQHATVTNAVRQLNLSCIWTVEYTFDLLLLGGLFPEAVWLAHKLGDWKMAVSVGVVYNFYCQSSSDFVRSEKPELCIPLDLMPSHIFQEKLQSVLGHPASNGSNEKDQKYKYLTDPIEEEDANMIFNSMEEILKAAVMAEAEIVSETFQLLVDSAKDLSRKFYGLVPDGLYLPAPPLYCPQPSFATEDEYVDLLLQSERDCRQKVSGVIQRILLLLRAAHCSFPAAQWYIMQLKQARKIMQKIRLKSALAPLGALPENLLNYSKYCKMSFKPVSSGDHGVDDVSCKIIGCFRELCALCWMLHVRERLSDTCRRYQIARDNQKNQQENKPEFDACLVEQTVNALEWACRMLPFARFLNVEELIQDTILSLIGELPPIRQVAEILVKSFPNSEDVRVPLRDKYNALHQRLRHCIVKGPNSEEIMSVVIEDVHKRNIKSLKRVIKNIGSDQRNIWEPPEEEIHVPDVYCCDRLSLGTTLSRSTISDLGSYCVYSEAEAPDSLSEALLTEEKTPVSPQIRGDCKDVHGTEQVTECNRSTEKLKDVFGKGKSSKKRNNKDFPTHRTLPVVGEWEFERDDDEYMKFLDLFLTYVLERDLISHRDAVIPFLVSFSSLLRTHELNSLLFDIHTTLKRRQNKTKDQSIFRAGSCYTLVFESSGSKPAPLDPEKKNASKKQSKPDTSICDSVMRGSAKSGLFGLSHQSIYGKQNSSKENLPTPVLTQCLPDEASFHQAAPVHKYIYKAVEVNDTVRREELTPAMTFKYNDVARLLEWMIRWSDRKVFYDPVMTEPFQECPPMMHVKTSASAILISLWLLKHNCSESESQNMHHQKLQKKHISTYSSAIGSKVDKNSMASPPSADFWDRHVDDEPVESLPSILCKKQSEKNEKQSGNEKIFKDDSVTCDIVIGEIDLEKSLGEKLGESKMDDMNVASENEDCWEEPLAVSQSPTISVSIKSLQQKPEPYLPVSELECPQQDPLIKTLETNFSKLSCTRCETAPSNISHPVYAEINTEIPSVKTSGLDDQPSFAVGSKALSDNPVGKEEEEPQGGDPGQSIAQQPNVSDAVRQMLQDEMFKLVQLQQINFMSLMQVVGSSFASLSNVSQQIQPPQFFQLGASHASNVREANTDLAHPELPAGSFPAEQMPMLENSEDAQENSPNAQERSRLFEQTHQGNILDSVPVSNSLPLPKSHRAGARPMPLFQSLPQQIPCRPLPLLTTPLDTEEKPKLIPLAKQPSNNGNRLPLLKLTEKYQFRPLNISLLPTTNKVLPGALPFCKEAWGPPPLQKSPPSIVTPEYIEVTSERLHLNKYDDEDRKQDQKQGTRWAETVKYLHQSEYEKKDNWTPSRPYQEHLKPEKSLADNEISFPKASETYAKIPLLNLKPHPKFNPPSAKIAVKITKESKASKDSFPQAGMPLLYTDLPPLTKFQIPKLIPLQTLIAFEQSRHVVPGHEGYPETIQLLKANLKPQEVKQNSNNQKRQKRRAEKEIKEKEEKASRADSLGHDDARVSSNIEKQKQENEANFRYVLPRGDCFLDPEAVTTSAGLHYLASVRRKATDLQDASTNTDIVSISHQDIQTTGEEIVSTYDKNKSIASASVTVSKSYQNVQTFSEEIGSEPHKNQSIPSASVTEPLSSSVPQLLPPDLYLNLRFPTKATETPLPSALPDTTPELAGQDYIHVVDIESSDCLENLPVTSVAAAVPSSAELHTMAASVTNAIPPEEFQKEGDHLQTELYHMPPDTVETEIFPGLPLSPLHSDSGMNSSTGLLARKMSKEHFSTKLQEMDRQLLALQNVAERMEEEFRNTKLLVETIEDVHVTADLQQDEASFFVPDVQVSKPEMEHYSPHVIMENLAEEEESLEVESPETSYIALQIPPASSSTSAANLGVKKSTSDIKFSSEGLDESFSQDPLQITGLSGVSDIIVDLLMERGASASELGLTETQARKIASISKAENRRSRKAEKDKKELQVWMKRKKRERLAEYLQTRNEQRAKELNPFHLRKRSPCRITGREIKLQQKKKEEKNKALLSEHHNIRVAEALTLMHELLSDTQLPSSEPEPLSQTRSSRDGFKRLHITSVGGSSRATTHRGASKASLRQTRSFSSLSCDVTPRKGRICQAPFRRMTSESSQSGTWWKSKASQKQQLRSRVDLRPQGSVQSRKLVTQKSPQTSDIATQADEKSDEDALSDWSVPDEIQRILYGSSNLRLRESASQEESYCAASSNILENVSESTSSILSKLDWNAVEAMVAEVEEN